MAISLDGSTPARVAVGGTTSLTEATASFSPPAASLAVAEVAFSYQSNTGATPPTVSVFDGSNTFNAGPAAWDTSATGTWLFYWYYPSAPGSISLTATRSSLTNNTAGFVINTYVLDGAYSLVGASSSAHDNSGSTTLVAASITPTQLNSWVVCGGTAGTDVTMTVSGLTSDSYIGDSTDGAAFASGHAVTSALTAESPGWTIAAGPVWSWAALEVLPAVAGGADGTPVPVIYMPSGTWKSRWKPKGPRLVLPPAPTPLVTVFVSDTDASGQAADLQTLKCNFSQGTAGNLVTYPGTAGAPGISLDFAWQGGGTLQYVSSPAIHSPLSCEVSYTAGTSESPTFGWNTSFDSVTKHWFRMYLYFPAYPSVETIIYETFGTGLTAKVTIGTSGLVHVYDTNGGGISTSSIAMPLNQWCRLEGFFFADPLAGQTEVKLFTSGADNTSPDETDTSAATQNTGTFAPTVFAFGNWPGATQTSNWTYYTTSVGLSGGGYLGPDNGGAVSSSDASGAAADSGSVSAAVSSSDASSSSDSGSIGTVVITDTDSSGPEADSGTVAVTVTTSDASGAAADSGSPPPSAPADNDAGTGTDSSAISAALADSDSDGPDQETGFVTLPAVPLGTAMPSRTWSYRFAPELRRRPVLPVFITPVNLLLFDSDSCHGTDSGAPRGAVDTDSGHGEDSGFANIADTDLSAGTDSGLLVMADTDAEGPAADIEKTAWPQDTDGGGTSNQFPSSGETEYWTGPLSDPVPDTGHGTDGPTPVTFQKADTESCAGTDAHIIDVYSFQPPFRWTGGGFQLVVPHPHPDVAGLLTLWQGDRVDGTALRLYEAFAAGLVHFVSASDGSSSEEAGEVGSLVVALHITPAHVVKLEVS